MDFNELVPGATVRFTVIGGVQYLSIRDLIMVVCDQDNKHASTTWINLADDKKKEVSKFLGNFKFTGPGQKEQPVITFPGALKLMMWLPGENAKNMRTKAADILTRYFAGDKSLMKEIESNAASDAPLNVMARNAIVTKTSELEAQTLKKLKLDNVTTFCNIMQMLRPTWRSDQRLVLQTECWLKNAAFDNAEPNAQASVSVGQVAREMGYRTLTHGESCKVGRAVAQAFRARHGADPPTHKQWVDGAERDVKSYTEADRDLIESAIRCVMI